MKRSWQEKAADAFRRFRRRDILESIVAGAGAAIAIGVMEWFSQVAHYPPFIIPFATSIMLVMGSRMRSRRDRAP
jgi:hypothetical protein